LFKKFGVTFVMNDVVVPDGSNIFLQL